MILPDFRFSNYNRDTVIPLPKLRFKAEECGGSRTTDELRLRVRYSLYHEEGHHLVEEENSCHTVGGVKNELQGKQIGEKSKEFGTIKSAIGRGGERPEDFVDYSTEYEVTYE